jgi:branched-chain amino acid aminotransferase
MSIFFNFNGNIYKEGAVILSPDNRSFKYGDGLFETMKVINGNIRLGDYHFERLFAGMQVLHFQIPKHFTAAWLVNQVSALCKKNQHNSSTRIRLTVFRGNGGLYDTEDHLPNYIIQTWGIENTEELNSNGLIIDLYPEARKSCDKFANLKTNNFLPYAMAANYAKEIMVNDCVVLNSYDRICDTTLANIFIIKDNVIYTPALTEGCIAGVMRRFVIEKLARSNFKIIEKPISVDELEITDEVFLTNSIRGIRWVKQFRNTMYKNNFIMGIYKIINTGPH